MLRLLLLVGLALAFIDLSTADHKVRDPRIIDIKGVTESSDPKPKDKYNRAKNIRRQTNKTELKIKANQRRLQVQRIAMKRKIKAGLDLVGKALKQKGAIKVNDKGKIIKIDGPTVREVKNRFIKFTEMVFGQDVEKPCMHAAEFGMRTGVIANKIRSKKSQRKNSHRGIENVLTGVIISFHFYCF